MDGDSLSHLSLSLAEDPPRTLSSAEGGVLCTHAVQPQTTERPNHSGNNPNRQRGLRGQGRRQLS
jgi:hypothetical protein